METAVIFFENTNVVGIEENKQCSVVTENGKITASKIIIASLFLF